MIARAALVRVSPSRSVWSIYRFVDRDKIISEIAVTFKITESVKLTKDESKHLGLLASKIDKKEEKIFSREEKQFKKNQKKIGKKWVRQKIFQLYSIILIIPPCKRRVGRNGMEIWIGLLWMESETMIF